jgi:ribosomal protein S12 methylthiotransferase
VDTILESAAVREARNRGQALIVAGCLPQRFREDLPKLFPEVDAFMGIDQVTNVADIVTQAMARRAKRLAANPKSEVRSPKSEIEARFAELETSGAEPKEPPPDLPGPEQIRKTKPAHVPPPHSALRIPHFENEDEGRGRAGHPASPVTHHTSRITPAPASALNRLSSPLVEVTPRPRYIPDYATPRFRLTPRHFAYVKIAEGCNHPCSFCIIPRMRGRHRSRPQADIVAEAKALLADGVKELNLISQDTTYYGLDLRPVGGGAIASPGRSNAAARALPADAPTLGTLLHELNALPGDFWIRLLYTHPAHWTDDLIRTIAECPKVARYVDVPLQHIHENMLHRMRRETSQQYIVDLLRRIRAGIPGIALRTTFIVGFPGETEACFETLLDFIRETKFERLGVFPYSQETGTLAGKMADQVPDRVKRQRCARVMAAQRQVARAVAAAFVGRTIKVLIEGEAPARHRPAAALNSREHGMVRERDRRRPQIANRRWAVARGEADAPDIDGRVYVRGPAPRGEFLRVKVIGHTDYDLLAEPA